MTYKEHISNRRAITVIVLFVIVIGSYQGFAAEGSSRGDWLRGGWGVRFLIPAGERKEVYDFKVNEIFAQLDQLKSIDWVMINLTDGGNGSLFTSPNRYLEKIDPAMTPGRDLFGEFIEEITKRNKKVIVYFASEGPAKENMKKWYPSLKTSKKVNYDNVLRPRREKWLNFLKRENMDNFEGVAKYIIQPYSERYGANISGWWFDHGQWGDAKLYSDAARAGNQNSAIAWNQRHSRDAVCLNERVKGEHSEPFWGLARSNLFEDYTAGHVTRTELKEPWSAANECVIKSIEKSPKVDGAIAHYFIPVQRGWRTGKDTFPTGRAVDWSLRTIKSKGAITWAIALDKPEFKKSRLNTESFRVLKAIDNAVLEYRESIYRLNNN